MTEGSRIIRQDVPKLLMELLAEGREIRDITYQYSGRLAMTNVVLDQLFSASSEISDE